MTDTKALCFENQQNRSSFIHHTTQYENSQSTTTENEIDKDDRNGYNECFNGVIEEFSAEEDSRLSSLTALPSGIRLIKSLKTMEAVRKYFQDSCGIFKPDYLTEQIQREAREILIQPELSSKFESNEIQYYITNIQESLAQVAPQNPVSFQQLYQETQSVRELAYLIKTSDLGTSNIPLTEQTIELTSKAMQQLSQLHFELQLSYIGALLNSSEDIEHCSGYCQNIYSNVITFLLKNPELKDEFLRRLGFGSDSDLVALKLSLMKGRPITIKELQSYQLEPSQQICGLKGIWHDLINKIDRHQLFNYIIINKDSCGNYIELLLKNEKAKLIINDQKIKRQLEVKFNFQSAQELVQILSDYALAAQ